MTTTNGLNNQTFNADFTVNAQGVSAVGITRSDSVVHADNTSSSSNARQLIQVGGASGGDPYLEMAVAAARFVAIGLDNTDSDTIKINTNTVNVDPSSGTTLFFSLVSGAEWGAQTAFTGQKILYNENLDGGATSDAILQLSSSTGAGGDPFVRYTIDGVASAWDSGIDNSDADSYKVEFDPTLSGFGSGTLAFKSTSTGQVTMPNTPVVSAFKSATTANATGNATVVTLICDTEDVDQNSNYNTGTGEFTAPVDGKYLIDSQILYSNIAAGHTLGVIVIRVNGTNVRLGDDSSPAAIRNSSNFAAYSISAVLDLTAGDVVTIIGAVSGSTQTVGINGTDPTGETSYFNAQLLC